MMVVRVIGRDVENYVVKKVKNCTMQNMQDARPIEAQHNGKIWRSTVFWLVFLMLVWLNLITV